MFMPVGFSAEYFFTNFTLEVLHIALSKLLFGFEGLNWQRIPMKTADNVASVKGITMIVYKN